MSSEELGKKSPLDQFYSRTGDTSYESTNFTIEERAFLSHINLRGDPTDVSFLRDTAGVLNVDLPLQANTWVETDGVRACWLGPNEWLIITTQDGEECSDALRKANMSRFVAVTLVSGGQTVLRLSGKKVRDIFSKGSTIDFHSRSFFSGKCVQSTLGKAPALFVQVDDEPIFEVVIRRSFSDYIGHWLHDAAHEFGYVVVRPANI